MEIKKSNTQYLLELSKIIDEEITLVKSYDKNSIAFYSLLSKIWEDGNFDKFRDYINKVFDQVTFKVIVPSETPVEQDSASEDAVNVLRIYTITNLVDDILDGLSSIGESESYQRLSMLYPNQDVKVLSCVIDITQDYTFELLQLSNELKMPDAFTKKKSKFKKYLKSISEAKSFNELFDLMYDFYDFLSYFLEDLEGQEYDWSVDEVIEANSMVGWFLCIETTMYFLLLIKEIELAKMDKSVAVSLDWRTDIYDQRQDALNELKVINELDFTDAKKHS